MALLANAIVTAIRAGGRGGGTGEDLLGDPQISEDDLAKFGGSRGAVAFARELKRWEANPEEALYAVDKAARSMVGAKPGEPFRLGDVLGSLPFSTFLTKKRAFALFAEIGEAQLQGDHRLAMGLTGQAMRWLALSLCLREEESAWRVTFQHDPASTHTVAPPRKPDLFTGHLQDVRQVTALCGLLRDEDNLQLRYNKVNTKKKGKEEAP